MLSSVCHYYLINIPSPHIHTPRYIGTNSQVLSLSYLHIVLFRIWLIAGDQCVFIGSANKCIAGHLRGAILDVLSLMDCASHVLSMHRITLTDLQVYLY